MSEWIIYYNPKCGTCRNTLEFLNQEGIKPKVVEYLKNPLSKKEVIELSKKLQLTVREMIRAKESIFEELRLGSPKKTNDDLAQAVAENPILLQRPIVVHGSKAIISRPAELIKGFIEKES